MASGYGISIKRSSTSWKTLSFKFMQILLPPFLHLSFNEILDFHDISLDFLGISSVTLFGCHSRESACAWWTRKALSPAHQPLRRAPTERQATALSCQNFEESPSAFHAREWPPMMGSEGGGWVCLLSALWCISTANGVSLFSEVNQRGLMLWLAAWAFHSDASGFFCFANGNAKED